MTGMQLPLKHDYSCEEYLTQKIWEKKLLSACPNHPEGGCGFERLGTYTRSSSDGRGEVPIARYRCRRDGKTFSILPRFFAARYLGNLQQLEDQVVAAEAQGAWQAAKNLQASEASSHVDSYQWLRRRKKAVHRCLSALVGLLPKTLVRGVLQVRELRRTLGTKQTLLHLRRQLEGRLPQLAVPIGFCGASSSRPIS